jgi:hypothetical protein
MLLGAAKVLKGMEHSLNSFGPTHVPTENWSQVGNVWKRCADAGSPNLPTRVWNARVAIPFQIRTVSFATGGAL